VAAVTILTRDTAKANLTSVVEGTDSAALSDIERTTAGAATLWGDAFTTQITVGASGANLIVGSDAIIGPSDGTGVVVGAVGGAASTGSALQLQTFTNTQRGYLVPSNGMMIYNSDALTTQCYVNGDWENFPRVEADQATLLGEVTLGGILDYPDTGGSTASEIQYARVFLTAGVTYDAMKFYQVSGGSPSRSVNIGLYDQATPTSTTGTPNSRVAETGTTATATANNGSYVEISLSVAYTVTSTGFYWIAFIPDSATLKFATTAVYRADFLPTRRETGTGTTLPASAGTLTNPSSAVIYCALVEQ
jgi:hypothetical protein